VEPDPRVNLGDESLPYVNPMWMATLDDDLWLDQITIPGTHDAAADAHTSNQGPGPAISVICQDYYISNQMALGVRWFDVRLHLDDKNGVLTAFHGPYYLHKNFDDLLTAGLDFLQAFPSETLVYMIKQEHSSVNDNTFAKAVYDYLQARSSDLSAFWVSSEMPMMCEARGKIVIVSQYQNTDSGIPSGIHLSWDNNTQGEYVYGGDFPLWAQDHWSLYSVHYSEKIDEIEAGMELGNSTANERLQIINFTSCEKDSKHSIWEVANNINPEIQSFLLSHTFYRHQGAVMLNFAGGADKLENGSRSNCPELVNIILNMNDLGMDEVTIGSQVWLNKSLAVVQFSGGMVEPIPELEDCSQWITTNLAAWRHFSDDPCEGNFGGRLYNWPTVHPQLAESVCPPGFHVPTDSDWDNLITYLGGPEVAGGKMKEAGTDHWDSPNTGATNSSGFSALGRGYWGWGESVGLKRTVMFYTYSPGNDSVVFRALCDTSERIFRIADTARSYYAASIRCIKDSH